MPPWGLSSHHPFNIKGGGGEDHPPSSSFLKRVRLHHRLQLRWAGSFLDPKWSNRDCPGVWRWTRGGDRLKMVNPLRLQSHVPFPVFLFSVPPEGHVLEIINLLTSLGGMRVSLYHCSIVWGTPHASVAWLGC